jgi:hypothetical protein
MRAHPNALRGGIIVSANSEAIAVMERGGSIRELRRCLGSKDEALSFYANYHQQLYRPPGGEACCNCGQPADMDCRFVWRAMYKSRLGPGSGAALAVHLLLLCVGFVHLRTRASMLDFATCHGICRSCWRKMIFKRTLASLVHFVSLLGGFIALLVSSIGFAGYFYFRNDRTFPDGVPAWLETGAVGLVVMALCIGGYFFANALRVPRLLRQIPRFPFRYKSVMKGLR